MFDQVVVIGEPLQRSTSDEVRAAEESLKIKFPEGYEEYVTRFGKGIFGGTYIRIYLPTRILSGENNNDEWRERIGEYWFWDEGRDVLSKAAAIECVIIGDTWDGDELIVHPSDPEKIYILPRHSEMIYVAGHGLPEAIEWLCSSGVLTEAFDERNFEPDA